MSALFLAAAIVIGVIARLGKGKLVEAFVNGARNLLGLSFFVPSTSGLAVL